MKKIKSRTGKGKAIHTEMEWWGKTEQTLEKNSNDNELSLREREKDVVADQKKSERSQTENLQYLVNKEKEKRSKVQVTSTNSRS